MCINHNRMSSQVQGTNDSSIVSKHSIVQQGYFKDDYIHHFVCKYARRSPLINIGYYVRAVVIEKVLLQFLKDMQQYPAIQILSLGAGFDTSFFRLNDLLESKNLTYFEIDLPAVVMRKANIIYKCKELVDKLTNVKVGFSDDGLWSEKYRLMSGDLRNLSRIKEILSRFQFENGTPTLILSECSVTYMDEESSRRLIKFVEELLEDAVFITYEQISPNDGFGSVMIHHFMSIDSPLLSVSTYPTLKSQEKRFSNQGWKECCAVSVWEAFVNLTSEEERFRACSLEPFDEWEEWHLKCNHYTLVVAAKGRLDSWVPFENFRKLTQGTPQSNLFFNLDLKWMPKLKQFGHSSVLVTANNRSIILNIGGFGQIEDGPHRRIDKIRYVELEGDRCSEVNTLDTDVVFNCMYHSCTVFEETKFGTKLILYGGRASPLKCVNTVPVLINCNLTENKLSVDTNVLIKTNIDNETSLNAQPEPRWRHSACIIDFNNYKTFLVFGGCSKELKVFGDFWKIDLNNSCDYCWEQIICSESPCPRFSHCAIVQEDKMIISGGINSKLEVMNDIWIWNHKTKLWTEVLVTNMFPRYAHTSHVILNKLILVGGVSTQRETWPMVTVVDLVALNCTEYYHPFQSLEISQTYMLHNHSSVLKDGSSIYVIGGGGNCFSFGTKFNTCILVMSLPL